MLMRQPISSNAANQFLSLTKCTSLHQNTKSLDKEFDKGLPRHVCLAFLWLVHWTCWVGHQQPVLCCAKALKQWASSGIDQSTPQALVAMYRSQRLMTLSAFTECMCQYSHKLNMFFATQSKCVTRAHSYGISSLSMSTKAPIFLASFFN